MGRPRTPTQQLLIKGSFKKHPERKRDRENEPIAPALVNADPPLWLDDLAKETWQWYAPRLLASRSMAEIDLHNLEAFCSVYSRWRTAEADVAKNGIIIHSLKGEALKNPAVTVINESLKQLATFGAALGLDPSSRSRIKVPGGPTKNPFTAI